MITEQQAHCLNVIKRLSRGGLSPSLDEIGAEMGLVKSCVSRLVGCLVAKGHLRRNGKKWRSLVVVAPLEADIARLVAMHGLEAVAGEIVNLQRGAA